VGIIKKIITNAGKEHLYTVELKQISPSSVEISMEAPQNPKSGITALGHIPKGI
jgi:hypothetical protein